MLLGNIDDVIGDSVGYLGVAVCFTAACYQFIAFIGRFVDWCEQRKSSHRAGAAGARRSSLFFNRRFRGKSAAFVRARQRLTCIILSNKLKRNVAVCRAGER